MSSLGRLHWIRAWKKHARMLRRKDAQHDPISELRKEIKEIQYKADELERILKFISNDEKPA